MTVGDTFKSVSIGRYMFSLKETGTATPVGNAPDGARLDVLYDTDTTASIAYTKADLWKKDWGDALEAKGGKSLVIRDPKDPEDPEERSLLDKQLTKLRRDIGYAVLSELKSIDLPSEPRTPDPAQKTDIATLAKTLTTPPKAGRPVADSLWTGFDARLASGSDWVLIRTDGIAELDGRLAFQSADEPDEALVTMNVGGRVELNASDGTALLQQFLSALRTGLPVVLAVTFDAGRTAPSWAPNSMKRQAAGFWKYERLTRSQFVVIGQVAIPAQSLGAQGDITIEFTGDVYEVRTPGRANIPTAPNKQSTS